MATPTPLADRLLDAQVAWILQELAPDRLDAVIDREVDWLLAAAADVPLERLVDLDAVRPPLRRLAATVPASTTASTMVQATADLLQQGPAEPFVPAEVVPREVVEALVDELLALRPALAQSLDGLTESPLVGTLASRFVGRIVMEVLEANRSVAQKIPGVGSIVSMGTSAATKVVGAADKQLQGLVGDTAGKGASFAIKRLNKVVAETMQDPLVRDAVLEVWDLQAARPLEAPEGVDPERARRIAGAVQDVVIAVAPTAPAFALADAWVAAFLEVYGEHPVATLLEELELTRDDLAELARGVVTPVVAAAHEDGRLEALARERLAPFWASPEVTAILDGA